MGDSASLSSASRSLAGEGRQRESPLRSHGIPDDWAGQKPNPVCVAGCVRGFRPDVRRGDAKENDIPLVFKDDKGEVGFTNEFTYDPKTDSWQWTMSNIDHGKATPFGTEKLSRAAAQTQS